MYVKPFELVKLVFFFYFYLIGLGAQNNSLRFHNQKALCSSNYWHTINYSNLCLLKRTTKYFLWLNYLHTVSRFIGYSLSSADSLSGYTGHCCKPSYATTAMLFLHRGDFMGFLAWLHISHQPLNDINSTNGIVPPCSTFSFQPTSFSLYFLTFSKLKCFTVGNKTAMRNHKVLQGKF